MIIRWVECLGFRPKPIPSGRKSDLIPALLIALYKYRVLIIRAIALHRDDREFYACGPTCSWSIRHAAPHHGLRDASKTRRLRHYLLPSEAGRSKKTYNDQVCFRKAAFLYREHKVSTFEGPFT